MGRARVIRLVELVWIRVFCGPVDLVVNLILFLVSESRSSSRRENLTIIRPSLILCKVKNTETGLDLSEIPSMSEVMSEFI